LADDPKSSRHDPPHWDELVQQVEHGWVRERIGTGKRHKIGRFEGIREIGRGGFGLVLLVRDPDLDREVALKLYLPPRPGAEDAMFREAQLLAKLAHPNIIRVYEAGHYGDDVFHVMERVVGIDGRKFIGECESVEQIIAVYIAAGNGLAAAHDEGIIHGDFKPANILIPDDGGPVRVADFGLAQLMIEDGSGVRHRLGTVPYMAPEVLRGDPGDARSDQWSFCVALWETLEGLRPFAGTTATEVLEAIESAPRVVAEDVPEKVRAVVRVGLSIDPGERYPDMRTLVRELGQLLESPGGRAAGGESGRGRAIEDEGPLLNAPAEARRSGERLRFFFYGSLVATAVTVLVVTAVRSPTPEPVPLEPQQAQDDADPKPTGVTPEKVIELIEAGQLEQADALWTTEAQRREMAQVPTHPDSLRIGYAYLARAQKLQSQRQLAEGAAVANFAIRWGLSAAQDLRRYGDPTGDADNLIREAKTLNTSP
jgi:hypothetical protein